MFDISCQNTREILQLLNQYPYPYPVTESNDNRITRDRQILPGIRPQSDPIIQAGRPIRSGASGMKTHCDLPSNVFADSVIHTCSNATAELPHNTQCFIACKQNEKSYNSRNPHRFRPRQAGVKIECHCPLKTRSGVAGRVIKMITLKFCDFRTWSFFEIFKKT